MKKVRLAKKFLEELSNIPNVSRACEKLNISRNTIYKWIKEDEEFRNEFEEYLSMGTDSISDLAESKIISKINSGDTRASIFWLENNKRNYIKPRPASVVRDIYSKKDDITGINITVDYRKRPDNDDSKDKTNPEIT